MQPYCAVQFYEQKLENTDQVDEFGLLDAALDKVYSLSYLNLDLVVIKVF